MLIKDPYIGTLMKEHCLVTAGFTDWYLDMMPAEKVEEHYLILSELARKSTKD